MNKAISTPMAIIIIVILAGLVVGGVLAYQYYWQAPEEETETLADEIIDSENIAKSFCEKKDSILEYSSLMNFDRDKEKEIILMCDTLDLYVLNRKNENYQVLWSKELGEGEQGLYLRTIDNPKIIDLDKDGIDEIFISGGSHGGTCTGSFIHNYIYSPKYNELFSGIFGKGGKGYVGSRSGSFIIFEEVDNSWPCPEYDEGIKIAYLSNNLKKSEYQIFKNYLAKLLEEIKNKVPVE